MCTSVTITDRSHTGSPISVKKMAQGKCDGERVHVPVVFSFRE